MKVGSRGAREGRVSRLRYALCGLLAFGALNAFAGGYYGLAGAKDVPLEWLEGTPFSSYVIPSLILFTVVGGALLAAALVVFTRMRRSAELALAAGVVVFVWLAAETAMIGYVSWMQPATAMGAALILVLAELMRRREVAERSHPPTPGHVVARLRSLDAAAHCAMTARSSFGVDLYWLPLGADGHVVRMNGRIYEALAAWRGKRSRYDLYHSALIVTVPAGEFVIEQAWPIPSGENGHRGVVAEGAVGAHLAGSLRFLRYEIRRWRDGVIADIDEAVDSPQRLTDDGVVAERLLALVAEVPTPVWGRDELHAGEMWNSNSLISWLIVRSGLEVEAIQPPPGGRAPGWDAGIAVGRRQAPVAPRGAKVINPAPVDSVASGMR
jgi:hypothetical protein